MLVLKTAPNIPLIPLFKKNSLPDIHKSKGYLKKKKMSPLKIPEWKIRPKHSRKKLKFSFTKNQSSGWVKNTKDSKLKFKLCLNFDSIKRA